MHRVISAELEPKCPDGCGACCRDMKIPLTADAAEQLVRAGTRLDGILPPLGSDESWGDDAGRKLVRSSLVFAEKSSERKLWGEVLVKIETMKPGEGLFAMDGQCGNLGDDGRCIDYENRPRICRDFEIGNTACQSLIQNRGIPVSVSIRAATPAGLV